MTRAGLGEGAEAEVAVSLERLAAFQLNDWYIHGDVLYRGGRS